MDSTDAEGMLSKYLRDNGYTTTKDAAQQLQLTMLREWVAHLCTVLNEETDLNRVAKMRVIRAMIYGAVPRDAEVQFRKRLASVHMQDITRYGFDAGTGQVPQEDRV